jgi:hypothetical protein
VASDITSFYENKRIRWLENALNDGSFCFATTFVQIISKNKSEIKPNPKSEKLQNESDTSFDQRDVCHVNIVMNDGAKISNLV